MDTIRKVLHARQVTLTVRGTDWPAAEKHRHAIAAHWEKRKQADPSFFNGRIHVMTGMRTDGDVVEGQFIETDFANFLAWREGVFDDEGIRDSFGAGLVMSNDGGVLLGRQGPGNLNSGRTYPPGGFIDGRDVDDAGRIDIFGSIAREIAEETGIDVSRVRPSLPVRIALAGRLVSFSVLWRLALGSDELLQRASDYIAAERDGELEACVVVRSMADLIDHDVPEYSQLLLEDAFRATDSD